MAKEPHLKLPDLHMHSNFSCDCQATMQQMCQGALDNGITLLGFTEHYDLLPADPCYDYLDLSGWWSELERCRQRFAGELTILAGIELGEPHRHSERMRRLLSEHPWDYALGSLHWVGDQLIFGTDYFQQPADQAFTDYFAELQRMIEGAEFDILAHMDVVKRFGFDIYGEFRIERYEAEVRAVLRALADRGLALEINTSQLRRPVGQTSPARPVIKWFQEEGGRHVTLGSDAHQPDHVGHALQFAASEAQAAGFAQPSWFEQREVMTA